MDYKMLFTENGLTNINNFFNYMQNKFEYGWIDQEGNRHYGINDAQSYSLQSPNELLKSHIGICWDMTELYRCFFENMTSLKYETYYLFYDDNKGCPSHSILVFMIIIKYIGLNQCLMIKIVFIVVSMNMIILLNYWKILKIFLLEMQRLMD